MESGKTVKESEKRIEYWDNLKGLLIFLVVIAHFFYELREGNVVISNIAKIIYLFHMPAFAFISGYWTKSKVNISRIKKYLVYYLIGNTFMMWFAFWVDGTAINIIVPYYSFWYLIAIVIWKAGIKYYKKTEIILPISILIGLLIGLFPEVNNIFALSRIICFFPFFIFGVYFHSKSMLNKIEKNKKLLIILSTCILFYVVLLVLKTIDNISFSELLMNPYEHYSNILNRLYIYIIAFSVIFILLVINPKKRVLFVGKIGKNSLYIYMFHRIFTLIIPRLWNYANNTILTISISFIISILICAMFGNDRVKNFTESLYEKLTSIISSKNKKPAKKLLYECIILVTIITLISPLCMIETNNEVDKIYNVMSNDEKEQIDNAFSILFTGDLILLQDQVKRGYNINYDTYNFDDVFEYTEKYIKDADLSIGVFEGPMAGSSVGYSNSDFNDNIDIYLNYPDEFGDAVKNAGFDIVSIANNHIFDKGIDGAIETIDKLEELGIDYTGFYKDSTERGNIKIFEQNDLKFGVLSYTYGFNYWTEAQMLDQNYVPIIVDKQSKNFEKVKEDVLQDFERLEKDNVDVIIVMPHYGTQFSHDIDDFQKTWNNIFLNAGADIILGDHSHSVQPIEITKNSKNKNAIIVNCPGNFVNSYREKDGDAAAMVEVYLDKDTGDFVSSSIIPMYVQATQNSNYRAIPIYDIMNNDCDISTYEMDRVKNVFEIITKVMLGEKLDLSHSKEKLYYTVDGYKRIKVDGIEIKYDSEISKLIEESNSICFIGDSITEGTKNGGYGWYEPLINSFTDKKIANISLAGGTTKTILEKIKQADKSSELYIIAIGTNDIRYRDETICAMNESDYINNLKQIVQEIKSSNRKAKFVFIAPWNSMENDTISRLEHKEKQQYMERYAIKLKELCELGGYLYINPNEIIFSTLNNEPSYKYMVDFIHPNCNAGIELYSYAVQEASVIGLD